VVHVSYYCEIRWDFKPTQIARLLLLCKRIITEYNNEYNNRFIILGHKEKYSKSSPSAEQTIKLTPTYKSADNEQGEHTPFANNTRNSFHPVLQLYVKNLVRSKRYKLKNLENYISGRACESGFENSQKNIR
jgi:hypothetical protein